MSKHTPGPWTIEAPMGDDHPWIVEAGKQSYEWRAIASVHCDGEDIPVAESNANARLIAAAPEQHSALRTISEGVNTIIDNWMHWTDEQIREHLFGLQSVAQDAYDKAEKS